MQSVSATPLSPAVGARVDMDLGKELGAGEQQALRDLMAEHHLLVFRGQSFSNAQQQSVIGLFGRVQQGADTEKYISNVLPGGLVPFGELLFHSDLAFTSRPSAAISLYATEVSEGVASTRFASCTQAYKRLSPALKQRAESLRAVHIYEYSGRAYDRHGAVRWREISSPDTAKNKAEHPLVMRSTLTPEPALYLNDMQTHSLIGIPRDEGKTLLEELLASIIAPDNVYEHHWHNGDFLVWDNVAMLHARSNVGSEGVRSLRRASAGELAPELANSALYG